MIDGGAEFDRLRRQLEAGELTRAAPEWYRRVQEMRARADALERDLIRYLKHGRGLTWAEVASVVDANLSSRQAAQAKWKRLIDGDRRRPGGPGRGGPVKGQRKGRPADAGSDAVTQ